MEEIKIRRYKIRNDFCMCGKPKGFIGDITKGEWVKYLDHKAVVETMQNKIDELEKMNIKFHNCLESTYKYDLPKIDDLCDIAGVHKFTMLRNELEELLAKGIK